jgi:hypothetical protein
MVSSLLSDDTVTAMPLRFSKMVIANFHDAVALVKKGVRR